MANKEHLTKLQEGVEVWNAWRRQNPYIHPDLSEVNLSGADFHRANFVGVKFTGANLSKAYLSGVILGGAYLSGVNLGRAHLVEAHLVGADLIKADLIEADLIEADLAGANLTETDFDGANLSRAKLEMADLYRAHLAEANLVGASLFRASLVNVDLREANLYGADLSHVLLQETTFANVDLTHVKGLESCHHGGPSTIDHRTLQRSRNLPLSFLRGCGLPDTFIDYLPSLLNQPIQHYSCFISYANRDEAFAQRLHADLQDKGVRCWFAPEDMKIGDKIWDTIDKAIRLRDKVLLVLSRGAINSEWVEDEVTKAYAEERRRKQTILFPIRIDKTVMRTRKPWAVKLRNNRNIGDFCNWKDHDEYQKGLERLLRDLQIEKDKS